jgi:prolycopene isomerase
VGVQLATGETYRARRIVSNATRWDTFGELVQTVPAAERKWRQRYMKSPSFVSVHLGIAAGALPPGIHCHHVLLSDWGQMAEPSGTLFVSIPTVLDSSLAPSDHHIIHAFTPSWIEEWQHLSALDYRERKAQAAAQIIDRLKQIIPNLNGSIRLQEVGTPKTHRRFLGRQDGTYGPIPRRPLRGLLGMPFNRTAISGLYCVGDSTFPGQGLNAVAFSGVACAHRVAADLRL